MSEYVFCDRCNDSRRTDKVFTLPDSWVEAAGKEPGVYSVPRGYFPSSFAEARELRGWKEGDEGHVCEICCQLAADQKRLKISTTALKDVMEAMARAMSAEEATGNESQE